jgi:hypothetical protein
MGRPAIPDQRLGPYDEPVMQTNRSEQILIQELAALDEDV